MSFESLLWCSSYAHCNGVIYITSKACTQPRACFIIFALHIFFAMKRKTIAILTAVTVITALIAYIIIDTIQAKHKAIAACRELVFDEPFQLEGFDPQTIDGAKVVAIDSNNVVQDSAFINRESADSHSTIPRYSFSEGLSITYTWKIVPKRNYMGSITDTITISDIITEMVEEHTSLGTVSICELVEWKVNGKPHGTVKEEGCFN